MYSWQTYRADEIDLSEGLSRKKGEDCVTILKHIEEQSSMNCYCTAGIQKVVNGNCKTLNTVIG